jgi:hypothetical protein
MESQYPIRVTITLEINAEGESFIIGGDGKRLNALALDTPVIRELYDQPGGVRHLGELLYDDRAAAGACCLYQHLGCRWYCIKRCP